MNTNNPLIKSALEAGLNGAQLADLHNIIDTHRNRVQYMGQVTGNRAWQVFTNEVRAIAAAREDLNMAQLYLFTDGILREAQLILEEHDYTFTTDLRVPPRGNHFEQLALTLGAAWADYMSALETGDAELLEAAGNRLVALDPERLQYFPRARSLEYLLNQANESAATALEDDK